MKPHRFKLLTAATVLACLCSFVVFFAVSVQVPATGKDAVVAPSEASSPEVAPAPSAAGSASNAASDAASDAESDPAPAPDDDPIAYAPGYVLASIADGVSDGQAAETLAATPGLAGATIEGHVDGSIVKVALPAGLAVESAVDLLGQSAAFESAQPNYRYYVQETAGPDPDAATAALVRTAEDATASLVAGTDLGNALSTQSSAPNDPYYVRQWSLGSVNAPEAWDLVAANAKASSAVTVAVIDNGFMVNHEDLKSHIVDFYNAKADSTAMGTDNSDHGSHVAGIVSAVTNNKKGVASVANNALGLMVIRVSDSKGEITTDTILNAYTYIMKNASTHNVRVVNMSLGAPSSKPVSRSTDPALYDAIGKARNAGIVTVAAACNEEGNYEPPFYAYPGDFNNVVSVISLEQADERWNADGVVRDPTSNYNTLMQFSYARAKNISAPGAGIYSAYSNNYSYAWESGTSMSSPLVAGVIGLMFTVNPDLTAAQAESLLYSSAKDLVEWPAGTGWDYETGYGEVDAAAAVAAAGATASSTKGNIASCQVTAADAAYTGSAVSTAVKVVDGKKTLTKGVDYTVKYRDNTKVGKATVTVQGKGGYNGIAVATFTISKNPLTAVTLKSSSAVYNGKSHKPSVKSVATSKGTVGSSNYTVTYLRNDKKTANFKKVGPITVKVTGKNRCKGTVTKTFTIKPRGTSIQQLRATAAGVSVKWKKQATQTSGYQIKLATDSAFTENAKTVNVGKNTTVATTLKSLDSRTRYYLKMRTYKTVNGKKCYSSWSKTKTVTTKK